MKPVMLKEKANNFFSSTFDRTNSDTVGLPGLKKSHSKLKISKSRENEELKKIDETHLKAIKNKFKGSSECSFNLLAFKNLQTPMTINTRTNESPQTDRYNLSIRVKKHKALKLTNQNHLTSIFKPKL